MSSCEARYFLQPRQVHGELQDPARPRYLSQIQIPRISCPIARPGVWTLRSHHSRDLANTAAIHDPMPLP